MKPISLFVLGVMTVAMSAPAQAQVYEERRTDTKDPIEKPLLAAPNAAMARNATVIKWIRNPAKSAEEEVTAADFTFEVLRPGPGRMMCYDLTGWPGERPWSVECTSSDANLPRIAQNRAFAEMGAKAQPLLGRRQTRQVGQAGLSCRAAAPEGLGSWFWPPRKTERVSCPKSGPCGITSGATARTPPSGTRLSACRASRRTKSDCRMFATRAAPG